MAISNTQPKSYNFLAPGKYRMTITKIPNVIWFLQKVKLPGISTTPVIVPTPFVNLPRQGDHVKFGQFSISFKIDEDFYNYGEIFDWMKDSAKLSFEDYQAISNQPSFSGNGIYSDCSLTLLDSQNNPKISFQIKEAFPIYLSDIDCDSTITDIEYLTAEATFALVDYDIERHS